MPVCWVFIATKIKPEPRETETMTSCKRTLVKRLIRTSTILLAIIFLLGASTNSFALPPGGKVGGNQACDKVSGPDIVYANEKFVLSECKDIPEPVEGEEPEEPEVTRCSNPGTFNADPSCWA